MGTGKLAAGATLGGTVLFAPAADAATFTVTNLDGTGDGSLRDAVADANAAPGVDDVVVFQSGLSGTITLANFIPVDEGVEIQGPGAGVVTVSGDDATSIFYVNTDHLGDPGEQVTISGLTLTEGFVGGNGGAIFVAETALTLSGVALTDSHAQGGTGGAISAHSTSLTILSSTFSGNSASAAGGAIYRNENPYGAEVIRDSTFTGNESTGSSGGALALYDSYDSPVLIESVMIAGNSALARGGGIHLYDWEADTPLTISNSTITGNSANSVGGGIHMYTTIPSGTPAPVTIQNTTISANTAETYGGGIRFSHLDGSTPVVRNSTIVGNSGGDAGGGIEINDYPADNGPVALSSVIVANNTAITGNDIAEDGPTDGFEIGFSLIEDLSGAPVTETPAGSNITGIDPQLGPLQNNGGPTLTHAPSFTSPVIDKGVANGLTTDQRGSLRTFDAANFANATGGDGTDIGSVELLPGGRTGAALASCKGATENLLFAPGTAIVGTDANDVIVGTPAADQIASGKGKDKVCAGAGNDGVKGGAGKDNVAGQAGKDKLKGNGGNDKLQGNAGRDTLKGGGGKDTLKGGGGKDKLVGGPGRDKLRGGAGKDSERQ